jgi:hypothetical protein
MLAAFVEHWECMCVSASLSTPGASFNRADLLCFLFALVRLFLLQPAARLLLCLCGRTYRRVLGTVSNTYSEQHTCGQSSLTRQHGV